MIRAAVLALLLTVAFSYRLKREAKDDVEAVIAEGTKKMQEGDWEGFVNTVYDDDAILFSPDGKPHKGKEAIINNFKAKAERYGGLKNVKVTMDTVVSDVNLYVGLGNFQVTLTQGETEVTKNMRSITVFSKKGGTYKAVFNGIYRGDGSDAPASHRHRHRRYRREAGVAEKLQEITANAKKLMKEGKMDEAVQVFQEGGKLVKPNGGLVEGREAIKTHYTNMMQKYKISSMNTEVKKVIEDGNLAIELAKTTVKSEKDGQEHEKIMGVITVWQKVGDTYKIALKGVFLKAQGGAEGGSSEGSSESAE
jgi:ketosteroid isomerase-like protein